MRLEVGPAELHVVPGTPSAVVAQVFNTDDVINAYEIRVFGVDPAWVELERERLSLFPSSAGIVTVLVNVPEDYPAGPLQLGVEVTPAVDQTARQLGNVTLIVPPRKVATMHGDPSTVLAGRKGTFNLTLTNEGNAPLTLDLTSLDPEAKVTSTFFPPTVDIVPGEQVIVPVRTKARPPIMGAPAPRLITFTATGADNPLESLVSFVQKPTLGRGLISLFGMLMAVTVFALVLTSTLGRVVDVSKVDAALLKRAIEGAPEDRGVGPEDGGKVTGLVTQLSSGAPVSGATVELFKADDPAAAVTSKATDEKGSFTLDRLNEGKYKVKFTGAGFVELWYGGATTFEDADEIDVKLEETTKGIDIAIGGIPGSIAGTVLADDATDATITLQVPSTALDSPAAQIQQVVAGADGAFLLEKVPAPATYELVVAKTGYTTVTRVVNLGASEQQEGIEVRLRRGDGLINGLVTESDGTALGGVTITATNTVDTVSTISLTTGDIGSFSLRNLPTPATYTITFAKDGFATENLTLALDEAEQLTDQVVTLAEGTGSISGDVELDGVGPIGGVLVTISNSEVTLTTETLSVGSVGSYIISNLPVPGTYTVTFSGDDIATQVRSVDLDPADEINVSGIDATLTTATATVSGTVSGSHGRIGGVAVELSDGTNILSATSADDPLGEYVIAGIPPGTYTLTFTQVGAVPRSVLVTLAAGESRDVDVTLDPQAIIAGTVLREAGTTDQPLQGAQVTAYKVSEFPNVVAATALTDEDGDYVLTGLDAPEEYIVEFAYPEGAIAQSSVRVVLDAGEQDDDVDATLTLAGVS